ncbi:hypothetical protein LC593_03105 [Nostoc sp. CHAB 5844]|nr:hypothetical protein [Nostoc sp. CHAB 5844]
MEGSVSSSASQPPGQSPWKIAATNNIARKQSAKVAYSITLALPGKVAFCVPRINDDPQYLQRLENLLKADPVVTTERININAASVVITYKTGTLQDSKERKHQVVEAAIRHLTSLIQSANEATAGIAAHPTSRI